MRRIRRLAKVAKREVHKRRRMFIVDTLATTLFWFVVHGLKDVFIVRLTLTQVLLAGLTGMALNILLGGVYGQFLNYVRRKANVREDKTI